MREKDGHYEGHATIHVGDANMIDVEVVLDRYLNIVNMPVPDMELPRVATWDGHVEGLSNRQKKDLLGRTVILKLQEDGTGKVVLTDLDGSIEGVGRTIPFDSWT